ncbi:hypothetical protein LK09_01875 [Microbacterium mangrovi]|uniref:Uncharacterized protein n=1 Tax=Microbacterium mangrovi TaxID=1348253 RepID=A0A0B2ACD8_9MICO|nr:hypothetical protein [Microbacterium mangrovi]KHK99433.1 hypothetical protein LK09_01875 [Microbacterium mangrovi]
MGNLARLFDPATDRWRPVSQRGWDAKQWRTLQADYTTIRRSPFDPYLAEGSVFTRDVSAMPVARNSAAQANWMATHINYGAGFGPTALNTSVSGTHPVNPIIVDSRMPGCDHIYMDCSGFGRSGYGKQILSGWVPWPAWLDSTALQGGEDSSVVIIDIGTGLIREYYWVTAAAGFENRFGASTGGFSLYEPDLARWEASNFAMQLQQGSNTVVRMHNWAGWIDIAGVRKGQIDHAIAFTCANMAVPDSLGEAIDPNGARYVTRGASWPAQSGDGDTPDPADQVPIHGQWARLPATLDLSPTGPYSPFLRVVIRAIQRYGMVCTDSNNWVHAFNAEPGSYEQQFLGVDPWSPQGDLSTKYRQANAAEGRRPEDAFSMAAFPWALTEWAPRHWGAPERIAVQ